MCVISLCSSSSQLKRGNEERCLFDEHLQSLRFVAKVVVELFSLYAHCAVSFFFVFFSDLKFACFFFVKDRFSHRSRSFFIVSLPLPLPPPCAWNSASQIAFFFERAKPFRADSLCSSAQSIDHAVERISRRDWLVNTVLPEDAPQAHSFYSWNPQFFEGQAARSHAVAVVQPKISSPTKVCFPCRFVFFFPDLFILSTVCCAQLLA